MVENQIQIPEGWKSSTINDLCIIGRGRVISQTEIFNKVGVYPVYSSQSQNNGEMGRIDTFDFDGDYVTWTTDGAYAGTVFFRTGKFNCTNVCGTLKEKEANTLDLQFLAYLLSTEAKYHVSYVGNPKLMNGVMAKILLQLPKDKTEQTTIANILSKTDQAIAHTEALIAKYSRIKTGLMQDLLTKGIDENGNIRSEQTHEFKDSPLGRIPKEWECDFLSSKVQVQGGYAFKSRDFQTEGVQLIRIGNLYNNQLSLDRDPIFLPKDFLKTLPQFILNKGDIILSMTGTAGKRDYGFAVQINIDEKLFLNQRVCKFLFNQAKIDKDFLLNVLHSEFYLTKLYESVTGTKQANLNSDNILEIYVPFPSIEEQSRISKQLLKVDGFISNSKTELSKLQSLKTGLMQDLLTGKVRVKI